MKRPNLFRLIIPAIFGGVLLLSSCEDGESGTEQVSENTEETETFENSAKKDSLVEEIYESDTLVQETRVEEVEEDREASFAEGTPDEETTTATEQPANTSAGNMTPKTTTTAKAVEEEATADVSDDNAEAKPEMTFEKKEYDFGEITQGDKVNYTFNFTNTGNAPLIISNARASCGCTVPSWPKEPIPPGDTGELEVVFNSAGKAGRQTKSIRISTNIGDQPEIVYLKGNVNLPK